MVLFVRGCGVWVPAAALHVYLYDSCFSLRGTLRWITLINTQLTAGTHPTPAEKHLSCPSCGIIVAEFLLEPL